MSNLEILLHIPHSSILIPPVYRSGIILTDEELKEELLRMTDWYTEELFDGPCRVVVPVSRLVCDVERFLDSRQESMVKKGMGISYDRTSGGFVLRGNSHALAMAMAVQEFYLPHQRRMNNLIAKILAEQGRCLIVDCHSFSTQALPYEDASKDRPHVCLGFDEFHKDEEFIDKAKRIFSSVGLRVGVNTPFSGSYVPSDYYLRDKRVRSVMIELRRGLYMDEATGLKLQPDFEELKHLIREVFDKQ